MGRGRWVTNVCYNWSELSLNFEFETDTAVVVRVQPVWRFRCHAYCTVGKTGDFPDLKLTQANNYFCGMTAWHKFNKQIKRKTVAVLLM